MTSLCMRAPTPPASCLLPSTCQRRIVALQYRAIQQTLLLGQLNADDLLLLGRKLSQHILLHATQQVWRQLPVQFGHLCGRKGACCIHASSIILCGIKYRLVVLVVLVLLLVLVAVRGGVSPCDQSARHPIRHRTTHHTRHV